MASNFDFLKENWQEFYENALHAEQYTFTDPSASAIYSRITAEAAIQWMYHNDRDLEWPYQKNLNEFIKQPGFRQLVGYRLFKDLDYIRLVGNQGAHPGNKKPDQTQSLACLQYLHTFLEWLVRTYDDKNIVVPPVDETLIPTRGAAEKSQRELQKLLVQFQDQQEEIRRQQEALAKSEQARQALEKKLEEVTLLKEQNQGVQPRQPYTELQTRQLFIDVLLAEAGWDMHAPRVKECAVEGMPTESGKGYADYVLWGKDGLPLAVVEAKRTLENERKGKTQGQTLCRLPGEDDRSASHHFLHQRLYHLAMG